MLNGIKDNWRKAEAAAVVQTLLEGFGRRAGMSVLDFDKLANVMVDRAWTENDHLFSGYRAGRPHKVALAAASLANLLTKIPPDEQIHALLSLCLSEVMRDLNDRGHLLYLSELDRVMISTAQQTLSLASLDGMIAASGPQAT
jgi:hypothetical protein